MSRKILQILILWMTVAIVLATDHTEAKADEMFEPDVYLAESPEYSLADELLTNDYVTAVEDELIINEYITDEAFGDAICVNEYLPVESSSEENYNTKKEIDSDKKIKVNITNQKGENILIKEGQTLYTSEPLVFCCLVDGDKGDKKNATEAGDEASSADRENNEESEENDETEMDDEEAKYYYSVSLDGGKNFGGYVAMDGNSIILYPDEKEESRNNYVLRFKYEKKKYLSSITVTYGGNRKEEIQETIVEEIVSSEYAIQFDNTLPEINVENPWVLDEWLSAPDELQLSVCDKEGMLNRIVAICDEEVVYEKHFSDEETVADYYFSLSLDRKAKNEEGQQLIVKISDCAGNVLTSSYSYYYDGEKPVLQLSGVPEGGVTDNRVEIVFDVIDNLDTDSRIKYHIEHDYNNETIIEDIEATKEKGRNFGKIFEEEGSYRISASCVDMAGNESAEVSANFDIDMNPPEINISGVSDNVDLTNPGEILISIKDYYYEGCNVSITAIKKKDGQVINLPVSSFDMAATIESRVINLKNDADYEILVSATDRLGRTSSAQTEFRIDKNAPQLLLEGLNDGQVTSEKPVISVNTAECFYDSTIVEVSLAKKMDSDISCIVDKQVYVMQDKYDTKEIIISEEGEYELTCTATDRSGNSKSSKMNFTVDYTPPVIAKMDDIDGKYFKSYTLNDGLFNVVKDMTKCTIKAFLNDDEIAGDELVVEEGKYVLWVSAVDEADNYSEKAATFIIDHTAPQLVIGGLNKDGYIRKGNTLSVGLANVEDEITSVVFNGKEIEISEDNKKADIYVDEYGDYLLEVTACDKAGNVTDKIISTGCYLVGPRSEELEVEEKIIHNITGKIVNNDKNTIDVWGLTIGCIIVLSGITGLMIREILRAVGKL